MSSAAAVPAQRHQVAPDHSGRCTHAGGSPRGPSPLPSQGPRTPAAASSAQSGWQSPATHPPAEGLWSLLRAPVLPPNTGPKCNLKQHGGIALQLIGLGHVREPGAPPEAGREEALPVEVGSLRPPPAM